jgi:hypothetical protein
MSDTNKKRNPVKNLALGGAKAFNTAGKAITAPVRNVVAPKPKPKEDGALKEENEPRHFSDHLSEAFSRPVKAVEVGGKITYKAIAKEAEKIAHAGKRSLSIGQKRAAAEEEEWEAPAVPPDAKLLNMNVIIKKRLKGVSVKNFYETVWSEGNRTDKPPFYRPWLEADKDKQNISVEDWTFADATPGQKIVADWDGEEYSQKRVSCVNALVITYRNV